MLFAILVFVGFCWFLFSRDAAGLRAVVAIGLSILGLVAGIALHSYEAVAVSAIVLVIAWRRR